MLVLDLVEALARACLPVWAWATHFNLPRKVLRVLCGYFAHQRRVQFEPSVTAILGSKWSCLFLRMVFQDALSEAMKVSPLLKLKVFFVDEYHSLVSRTTQKSAGIEEKVLKSVKWEAEEKGLKLSIADGGKEGTRKVIASCSYLEDKLQELQQKWRSRSCNQRGNPGSGFEDENKAAGSEGPGPKESRHSQERGWVWSLRESEEDTPLASGPQKG